MLGASTELWSSAFHLLGPNNYIRKKIPRNIPCAPNLFKFTRVPSCTFAVCIYLKQFLQCNRAISTIHFKNLYNILWLIGRWSTRKTAVPEAFCCIQTRVRSCRRALVATRIRVGGICRAGRRAGTHCGGLEIRSRRHCPAEVTAPLYLKTFLFVVYWYMFSALEVLRRCAI